MKLRYIDFYIKSIRALNEKIVKPLNEFNLSRLDKHTENGYVIISAYRSVIESSNPQNDLTNHFKKFIEKEFPNYDLTNEQLNKIAFEWLRQRNKKADEKLEKTLRSSENKFSFSPIFGGYKGTDGVTDNFEPSYIIYNFTKKGERVEDFEELKAFAIKMCAVYKQDSVLINAPNETPNYYDADGNKVNSSSTNKIIFNDTSQECFSTNKRDKTNPQRFTADINFENVYITSGASSLNERRMRTSTGEILLDDILEEEIYRANKLANH